RLDGLEPCERRRFYACADTGRPLRRRYADQRPVSVAAGHLTKCHGHYFQLVTRILVHPSLEVSGCLEVYFEFANILT
ncbi:hypothetical protein LSTR_LSTR002443, partial [Laodelphax striatellus]